MKTKMFTPKRFSRIITTICFTAAISLITAVTATAQSWSELGTGANALNANYIIYGLTSNASGNIYTGGFFTDSSGNYYVAQWDGTTWSELGAGSNALNANSFIETLLSDASGNIYAAGAFTDGSGYEYVAEWNGTTWSELGTGSNALNANSSIRTLTSDASGNIYAAGAFATGSIFSGGKPYVAEWNGTTWAELGTGSNALNANQVINALTSDASGNIYTAGTFTNASGSEYVAEWNGTTWAELGAGANALNANNLINALVTDASGNIYAAGQFTDGSGYEYVAEWNGTTWAELGAGSTALRANNTIQTLSIDASGNIYAAGAFTNASGNEYVAKWNGTTWVELGTGSNTLNANNVIQALTKDATGNIYAGGQFTDTSNNEYVAKYTLLCDTVTDLAVTNITLTSATVNWTAVGGTQGYEVVIDQSATNPSGAGISDTNNTYNDSALLSGTTYYAHVRDSCGPTSFSAWATVPFITTACDSIKGLATTNITKNAATITWNNVSGTSGYEVVVGQSSAAPASGNGVTTNTYTATGLLPDSTYYVFVRDSCGSNSFSPWDTLSFTTLNNLGVVNVNGNNQFGMNIYPNPANDVVTVSISGAAGNDRKISLTDVTGRTINTLNMTTDKVELNMGNLAAGIYLVRYEDGMNTRVIKVNKQ